MKFLFALLFVTTTAWARIEPSILLFNITDNQLIVGQGTQTQRPLASITKVMTALVWLELNHNLGEKIVVHKGVSGILPKKSFTRYEILTAMLVRSDNSAAETLARDHPYGRDEFIKSMNNKAQQLGMSNTYFDDPSGLSSKNISTALDIMLMLKAALSNPIIKNLSTIQKTEIINNEKKKPTTIAFQNTNVSVLEEFKNIIFSKTGLTTPAGWCVALGLEENNKIFALIVLGANTKDHRKKIIEKTIIDNFR